MTSAVTPTRKRTKLAVIGLGTTMAVTGLVGTGPAIAAESDIVTTTEYQKDTWRQELLTKINSYRASKGLPAFKYSDTLSNIAQDESNENVRNESIEHSGNFGRDTRAGSWQNAHEISAWYSQINTTALVDGWKGSPGHNAIMLNPDIDVVGFGVTQADGSLVNTKAPWQLTAVMDGYNYMPGNEPKDTRTSVPITAPGPFKDVPADRVFATEIAWVKDEKILNGWSDGTFRPNEQIGRYAMAAVAYRMAGSPAYTPPEKSHFKDVKPGDAFYKEINWTKDAGIFNGWSDGTFRPNSNIGRYATAAMLYRMAGSPAYTAPAQSKFSDMKPGDAFYKEINWMADQEISNGWTISGGKKVFRPEWSTNRDQMAAFLYRYVN